uniref:Si:ch211-215a10.4 n=1 Tax=Astyanax mexicanus TaxID=7994 RepID=W5KX16_ASTMX
MAVCRGGVSLWVGCIRSHGGRQHLRKQSWSVWQPVDSHLNDPCRVLSSASWALAPPNSLRYQSVKKTSLSHPFHHACQPLSDRAHRLEGEFEETLSLCVLFKPNETDEQHTLVEVPLFGQVKLGDYLNLQTSKPTDFVFPLTTVDGRREDDISIIGVPWTEKGFEQRERGSFRSFFETEGCPAPFILGSHFYCFHCPPMEPVHVAGDRLRIEHEEQACSLISSTSLCSHAETEGMDRVPSERDMENEEKLSLMCERLRNELPRFFVKNHDYSMYSNDLEFLNGLLNTKTRGRVAYQLFLSLWRLLCLCYYAEARIEVLKLTKHPEDNSIKARWRINGLPFHTLMLRFYKRDKTQLYRTYDAFSTFYLGSDGLIHCHKVEKVMQAQPPVLPKVTSLLAGVLVALGVQEHRPALNLLPLFLSSFKQGRD